MVWQLQTAKQRFSELIDLALEGEPQVITRHGREVAVVLSFEEYRRLTGTLDFKRFLAEGPPLDELEIERDTTPVRTVEF